MPVRSASNARSSRARVSRRAPAHRRPGPPSRCSLRGSLAAPAPSRWRSATSCRDRRRRARSEEHTSELQSLMRISYAVFCLKKKKTVQTHNEMRQAEKIPTHELIQHHVSHTYTLHHTKSTSSTN